MRLITDTNRKWWILIAMGAGLIMLDETVVGVALPILRNDLGMLEVAAHWVVSAYMLVFAGIAVGSSLLLTTRSFEVVFLVIAAVMLVAVVFGSFAIEREGGGEGV